MKTFYDVLGDLLRRPPGDTMERLTPWIITVLSALVATLMFYAWWTGEW